MKRGDRQRPPLRGSRPQPQEEEGKIDWDELTSSSRMEASGSRARRGGVGARGTANGRSRGNGNEANAGRPRLASRNWSTGREGESVDVGRGREATAREWSTGRGGGATTRDCSTGRTGKRGGSGTSRGATAREWSTGRVVDDWNSGRGRGEDPKWETNKKQGRNRDLSEGRSQGGIQEGVSSRHPGQPELVTDRSRQRNNELESAKRRGENSNCRGGCGVRVARGAMYRSISSHENKRGGGRALEERGRGNRRTWNHRGDSGYSQNSAIRGRPPGPRLPTGFPRNQTSINSKLSVWQTDAADVIVCKLNCNNQADLNLLLADDDITPEDMCLFVKVLSVATASESSRQGVLDILITIFSEQFIAKLLKFQLKAYTEEEIDLKQFFRYQHVLLSSYFKAMPLNALEKIPELLQTVQLLLQKQVKDHPEQEWREIFKLYEGLLEHFNKYLAIKQTMNDKRKNLRDKLSILDSVNPDDDFREIPTEPTLDDITSPCKPFVRRNIVDGKYADVHTYLDVQFRLLREDFIRPLREGVQQYIGNTPGRNHNVRIYRNVQMINSDIIRGKLIYFIKLNFPKKIKLETSKRLMFGNLVCVSDDNFTTFFLALIGEKEDTMLREGIVGISPLSKVKINFSSSYTVVESTAFFVAYKHVLAALQRMDQDKFPLAKHIVFVEPDVERPSYLQNDPNVIYDMSALLNPSIADTNRGNPIDLPSTVPVTAGIDEWPSCESFGFDQSQLVAFHAALTSRLALIQGPPGTGKTFLGLKIVQTLLRNSKMWLPSKEKNPAAPEEDDSWLIPSQSDSVFQPPILVVCFTNHALDQFLEGMLNFTKKIVRVGSRSKNENIQKHQVKEILNQLKRNKSLPQYLFDASTSVHSNYSRVEDSFKNLQAQLARLVNNEGLLRFTLLERNKIIPPQISLQLTEASFRDWILPSNERTHQLLPSAPMRSIWKNTTESPQSCEENVENEAQWLDAMDLAREEEEDRMIDDYQEFHSRKIEKNVASAEEFEILSSIVDDERKDLENDLNSTKKPQPEKLDRYNFLCYLLHCLGRLASFTKTDVTGLELIGETNVHRLCFQDRCLLYATWKKKLENTYLKKIADLEDRLQKFVEGGVTDDLRESHSNTAAMVDLNARIRNLQSRLAGVTKHEGVLEWDILISNGVVPKEISDQLCSRTYDTWIMPLDPRIPAATIRPYIWKLWRNTTDPSVKVLNESDLRKWKVKMEMLRKEISISQCDPHSPEFLSVSSEDPEYEVFLGNYDLKLKELDYLARNEIISSRNYEMMSRKIHNEKDCLGRVLSFTKKDVTGLKIRDDVNVHDLAFADRCLLYATWKQKLITKHREKCRPYEHMVQQLMTKIDEVKRSQYLHVARQAEVVGMTTTGAAEYQGLIQDLQPKIVVIEEAAEILEAHVVTSLTASCEHLIMIGDHQQLRPSAAVYELATKYGLETSMFERMIKNGLPYQTLEYQHRMRPDISRLLVPAIYPQLKDHESVALVPPVPGMTSSVFFFTHDHKERAETDDNNSHSNPMEAAFTLQLARHLVLQGYSPHQITVLTPYSGQFFLLKQELRQQPHCEGMLVTILDNYQGEENDIILLSLVRNNDQGNVGFLKTENRVCVALSRAKQGLYILGNIDQLCQSTSLWMKIKDSLTETNSVGKTLTLQCQNHPDQLSVIKTTQDFLLMSPEGGCSKPCSAYFPKCSHPCPRKCHVIDPTHEVTKCMLPCEKKCEVDDHDCKALCWEDCPNCLERVTIELRCGHSQTIACYRSTREDLHCPTMVAKEIPDCKHVIQMECSNNPLEAICTASCSIGLDCGHACSGTCHVRKDPNHETYSCRAPCAQNNKNCSQEHKCPRECHEECLSCTEMVSKKASCGHSDSVKCTFDMKDFVCKSTCKRMLKCEHRCPRKCFEECGGCKVKVEKILPGCGHAGKFPCSDELKDAICQKACSRLLKCGHKCSSKCCEECGGCKVKVEKSLADCDHVGKYPCGVNVKNIKCQKPCTRLLECEHQCLRKCSEPCGGCQVKVKKMLSKCGHTAIVACSSDTDSLQCKMPCKRTLKCGHNCSLTCSEECSNGKCSARVTRTAGCGHTVLVVCSHDMVGYKCKMSCKRLLQCGHKCPRKCSQECGGCRVLPDCGQPMFPCNANVKEVTCKSSSKKHLIVKVMSGKALSIGPDGHVLHKDVGIGAENEPTSVECVAGIRGEAKNELSSVERVAGSRGEVENEPTSVECVAGSRGEEENEPTSVECVAGSRGEVENEPTSVECVAGSRGKVENEPTSVECVAGSREEVENEPTSVECVAKWREEAVNEPTCVECVAEVRGETENELTGVECVVALRREAENEPTCVECVAEVRGETENELTSVECVAALRREAENEPTSVECVAEVRGETENELTGVECVAALRREAENEPTSVECAAEMSGETENELTGVECVAALRREAENEPTSVECVAEVRGETENELTGVEYVAALRREAENEPTSVECVAEVRGETENELTGVECVAALRREAENEPNSVECVAEVRGETENELTGVECVAALRREAENEPTSVECVAEVMGEAENEPTNVECFAEVKGEEENKLELTSVECATGLRGKAENAHTGVECFAELRGKAENEPTSLECVAGVKGEAENEPTSVEWVAEVKGEAEKEPTKVECVAEVKGEAENEPINVECFTELRGEAEN